MTAELDDAHKHNANLEKLVVDGCVAQRGRAVNELRRHDLHDADHPSVAWLLSRMNEYAKAYTRYPVSSIGLRGIVLRRGNHISTHTESRESNLGMAYWPSGNPIVIGTPINENGDSIHEPTFVIEDPSRAFSDLRLPFEDRHSVNIRPRPGLLAVFPAHVPHNMHPYMGTKAFVHIVAQVRIDWPKEYFRS
ncbi:hypothetical protein [Pandoraea soli]